MYVLCTDIHDIHIYTNYIHIHIHVYTFPGIKSSLKALPIATTISITVIVLMLQIKRTTSPPPKKNFCVLFNTDLIKLSLLNIDKGDAGPTSSLHGKGERQHI